MQFVELKWSAKQYLFIQLFKVNAHWIEKKSILELIKLGRELKTVASKNQPTALGYLQSTFMQSVHRKVPSQTADALLNTKSACYEVLLEN